MNTEWMGENINSCDSIEKGTIRISKHGGRNHNRREN